MEPTTLKAPAMDLAKYLGEQAELIDRHLDLYLPRVHRSRLAEAMRYSVLAKAKRIRPILTLAACEAVNGPLERVLPTACALEMIHTFTLIHDDLPAMDNDDLRRGQPANHKVFGEALAILAGDALLTQAYDTILRHTPRAGIPASLLMQLLLEVTDAIGIAGVTGGQAMDIEAEGREIDWPTLQYIHTHKTGALLLLAVRAGGLLGGADEQQQHQLSIYAEKVGLVFQVVDDILDVTASSEDLGKSAGKDVAAMKATFPRFWGLERSWEMACTETQAALDALKSFGPAADPLRALALFILRRDF